MLLAPLTGRAQDNPPPPYKPGVGDLMTMTVQPRHTKLGLAGQLGNWAYAEYEQHELQEAFDRIARVSPKWRNYPIAELLPAMTKGPMGAVAEAIQAGDVGRFNKAYRALTDACNACHSGTNRAMVVIQPPSGTPFPDQDFRPRH